MVRFGVQLFGVDTPNTAWIYKTSVKPRIASALLKISPTVNQAPPHERREHTTNPNGHTNFLHLVDYGI